MTEAAPALLWFRQDLRLGDNPALHAAAGRPLLPVYVLDDESGGRWARGGVSRWWPRHPLAALRADLAGRGLPLALARGRAGAAEAALAKLPDECIRRPWGAALRGAGVALGRGYPRPVVGHAEGRRRALDAFAAMRREAAAA